MFLTSQSLKSCLNNSSEYPNSFFSWSQEVIGAELQKDVSSLQLAHIKDVCFHQRPTLEAPAALVWRTESSEPIGLNMI